MSSLACFDFFDSLIISMVKLILLIRQKSAYLDVLPFVKACVHITYILMFLIQIGLRGEYKGTKLFIWSFCKRVNNKQIANPSYFFHISGCQD